MPARSLRPESKLALAAGSVLVIAAVAAVFAIHPSNAAAPEAPQAVPVMVAAVEPTQVTPWDEFSGRLEAVERVDVRSRVAGAVQAIHFREGALVNSGDLLVTIDPAPYAAEVERASAQVLAAQARLDNAGSEVVRAKRIWD
jgi:multidrug efflux system membrane fusion protein